MHYTPKQRAEILLQLPLPVSPCDLVIRSLEAALTLYLEDIAAELNCTPGTFPFLGGAIGENESILNAENRFRTGPRIGKHRRVICTGMFSTLG